MRPAPLGGRDPEAWPARPEDSTAAVPSLETVRYELDLSHRAMGSDGPAGQGARAYRPYAKGMPLYKMRAEKCTVIGVKATIYNESRFYRWDGSQWLGDGETVGRDLPIDSVMEAEVNIPMLRRKVILTRRPCFFAVDAEEDFVYVSIGELESAMRNRLPLTALVMPGSRVVIEPARHSPTPYPLEPGVVRQPIPSSERWVVETLMGLKGDGKGLPYDHPHSYHHPSSAANRGAPPGPHFIAAPLSSSSERMADWSSNHVNASTGGLSSSVTPMVTGRTVRYVHQEPRHALIV